MQHPGIKPLPSLFVILMAILTIGGNLMAQDRENQIPEDLFADGAFQNRKVAMGNLVKLKLNGKALTVNRHWGPQESESAKQDRLDKEAERLIERGMDPAMADRLVRRQNRKGLALSKVQKAFFGLKGVIGSLSSSQSGNQIRLSMKNAELAAVLTVNEIEFVLSVEEKLNPNRAFKLQDNGRGVFEFDYYGDDFKLEMKQQADGKIDLTRRLFSNEAKFAGDNYEDLKVKHPKLVKDWLVPVFEHIGFELPIMSDDRFVQDTVLSQLMSIRNRSVQDFEKYVRQLDDDSFQVRENATELLTSQMNLWRDAVRNKLKTADLSLESKIRLQRVMSDSVVDGSIDELIQAQDLLNSPRYLISLFEIANKEEQAAVMIQLESITGRSEKSPEDWIESVTQTD